MKKQFITGTFLLENSRAEALYHTYAENLPVIDYHCHIPPRDIAVDARYSTITDLWLGGDHYKWRAMRANGVGEELITGSAPPLEKFRAWAATVPATLGNPLYHWTHLELARYFNITDTLLNPESADDIYHACNEMLRDPSFSARGLLRKMNVEVVCTTDDPADGLEHHRAFAGSGESFRLLPAWRPDKALAVDTPDIFNSWIGRLGAACGKEIRSFDDFMQCLTSRRDFFHAAGCRLADHGIATMEKADFSDGDLSRIFKKVRSGKPIDLRKAQAYRAGMMHHLAAMNHETGWAQQIHIGIFRNINSRMYSRLGPDTGFDSIGDYRYGEALYAFLDRLDREGRLARTIIYPANPADNEMIATMAGSFQDGSVPGKMQFGSAWWFLDQKEGMERQMRCLAAMGLLARFIGMTTDSRSIMSYCRHEYFRRILCNMLGADMAKGLIPDDMELAGGMVRDICCNNARAYFGF